MELTAKRDSDTTHSVTDPHYCVGRVHDLDSRRPPEAFRGAGARRVVPNQAEHWWELAWVPWQWVNDPCNPTSLAHGRSMARRQARHRSRPGSTRATRIGPTTARSTQSPIANNDSPLSMAPIAAGENRAASLDPSRVPRASRRLNLQIRRKTPPRTDAQRTPSRWKNRPTTPNRFNRHNHEDKDSGVAWGT